MIILEPLNRSFQAQKILITFKSSIVPALIMKRRKQLSQWSIFPTRVFKNTFVLPLFRKVTTNSVPLIDKNSSSFLKPFWQISSNVLASVEPYQAGSIHLDNSVEEDLLQSFKYLSFCEQMAITDRLEALRNKLIESKELCSLMNIFFKKKLFCKY